MLECKMDKKIRGVELHNQHLRNDRSMIEYNGPTGRTLVLYKTQDRLLAF